MKRLFCGILLSAMISLGWAQSGTNSPYSQYGLGQLADQSQGFNRGMGGLAIALRNGTVVNMQNPASYSATDSLTMIIDAGMSGEITNFKEGSTKINAHNANFEYAVAAFRLMRRLGIGVGIVPYSNIGYNYSGVNYIGQSTTYVTDTHSGSGGLHQVFLGAGYEPLKGLSLGVNLSYLWGDYSRTISMVSNDGYVNTLTRTYAATISSYKIDFGVQYELPLNRNNSLTFGAIAGIGHKLGADATMTVTNYNTQTGVSTATPDSVKNGLRLPMSYGVGVAWQHNRSLTVGADVTMQQWKSIKFPNVDDYTQKYVLQDGLLRNRTRLTVGADWIPSRLSRNFFNRIHYRIGASMATPYYNINGKKGPSEMSVSAGFGIPIINSYNNRSVLNISAQWAKRSATDLITENTFRINVGLTFNERWFAKWKVD